MEALEALFVVASEQFGSHALLKLKKMSHRELSVHASVE